MSNALMTADTTEDERVTALAERVATALASLGGKVWSKGDTTRVYVRVGKKEGYVSIESSTRVEYPRSGVAAGEMYRPLVEAGIVSLSDISAVLP